MQNESNRSLKLWIFTFTATVLLVILISYTGAMAFGKIHGVSIAIKVMIVAIIIAHGVGAGVKVAAMAAHAQRKPFTSDEFATVSKLAVAEILMVIVAMVLVYTPSSSYGIVALIIGIVGYGIPVLSLWHKTLTAPVIPTQQQP